MAFVEYRIGRSNADIVIDDPTVSRQHAELVKTADGRYFLTDCASTAGTFVQRGGEWHPIRQDFVSADEPIRIGRGVWTAAGLIARTGQAAGPADHPAGRDPRDALPEGDVRRDPLSGEILEKTDGNEG